MSRELFDIQQRPLPWAMPLLLLLVWHIADTILRLGWQQLFFVCYTANILLCIGIFRRSPLLVGIGYGWLVIAFPLWLYDAILTANWEPSCTLFHIVGLISGSVAFRSYRFPKWTPAAAIMVAILLHILSRLLTDPALNINSAFRIYTGWEQVYPNYPVFYLVSLVSFLTIFQALTMINNRYVRQSP